MMESYLVEIALSQALLIVVIFKLLHLSESKFPTASTRVMLKSVFSLLVLYNMGWILTSTPAFEIVSPAFVNLAVSSVTLLYLFNSQNQHDSSEIANLESDLRIYESALNESLRKASIGTFSSRIAHNLSNMLTIILANTEMLKLKLEGDDTSSKHLLKIQESSNSTRTFLNRMVAFSEPPSGPNHAEPIQFILEEFSAFMGKVLPVSIELNYIDVIDEKFVTSNREELEQLLLLLVTNAYEATLGANGVIRISAAVEREADQDILKVSVCDNGPGIAQGARADIFTAGYSTKNAQSNLGIGLTLAASIVRDIDGSLCLDEDSKKVGCCFILRLHCSKASSN